MKKFSPAVKGLITGLLMAAFTLFAFYILNKPTVRFQNIDYIVFIIFTTGIVWTLFEFNKTATATTPFKEYFSYGFKSFIVAVLVMVIFTAVFSKLHPEIRDAKINENSAQLLKQGNHTPDEIKKNAEEFRNSYLTIVISGTLFLYLFFGAIITVITAAFMIQKKKQ